MTEKDSANPRADDETFAPRILVAEDNSMNRRLAEMMLSRLGYKTCMFVEDGEAAVAASRDSDYDIILMDLQMPNLNGFEATQNIREHSGSPNKPWIIALTGGATNDDTAAAQQAGMNDILFKPFDIDQLSEVLEKAKQQLHTA